MITEMTSSRPYLLRALNEWICDNGLTPHIVVDAKVENVVVPQEYVEAGKIVLNISPIAVTALAMENDYISFSARFSGKAKEIYIPVTAIIAIYAKENGQGMVFTDEVGASNTNTSESDKRTIKNGKPQLKLVK